MITQKYKQGEHEIKIENAESLEDASKNGFQEGEYVRFYVNGKKTDNYMAMIRFIVDESKNNQTKLIPSGPDLMTMRKEMIQRQHQEISDQLQKMKQKYGEMGVSEDVMAQINDYIDKIDPITGMRVAK